MTDSNASGASAQAPAPKISPYVTAELVQAVAVLEAQGVGDSRIAAVVGGFEVLAAVRASEAFVSAIAETHSSVLKDELDVDTQWNSLERDALASLAQQVAVNGANLDTAMLLGIAKQSNAARRRIGAGSHQALAAPAVNATVVINIPQILVQRMQTVIAESSNTKQAPNVTDVVDMNASAEVPESTPPAPEAVAPSLSHLAITSADVSRVLGIDVSQKPRGRIDPKVYEMQQNAELTGMASYISQLQG